MTEAAGPNGLKGCHGTHFLLTAVWARVAMALFGLWADLQNFPDVNAIKLHFAVPDEVWGAFTGTVGDFGNDLRLMAAFPKSGLLAGITQTVLPDVSALNPAQATQIGLAWRLARRVSAYRSGLTKTEFQDVDTWQEPAAQDPGRQSSSSAGIKEKILKMSALIDQSDDSELVPPTSVEINGWLQNYHAIMGAMPEESEEPSPNQLASFSKTGLSR